jgi:hypothetical protein
MTVTRNGVNEFLPVFSYFLADFSAFRYNKPHIGMVTGQLLSCMKIDGRDDVFFLMRLNKITFMCVLKNCMTF